VFDALALWKIPSKKGQYIGLEVIDGSSIKPLVDTTGRIPTNNKLPAYQQVIHGFPVREYYYKDLIYQPMNPGHNDVYGCSIVESIILTINSLTRKQIWDLNYFTEGSTPDGGGYKLKNPNGEPVTPEQLMKFQEYFKAYLKSEEARQGLTLFPEGEYFTTKNYEFKIEYYHWLVTIVCAAFSIPLQTFINQINRATAETGDNQQTEYGLTPLLKYMEGILTEFIQSDLGFKHLRFKFIEEKKKDEKLQAFKNKVYLEKGIYSINEIRREEGLEPIEGGDKPFITIGNQVYYIDEIPEIKASQEDQQEEPEKQPENDVKQDKKKDKVEPEQEKKIAELKKFEKFELNRLNKSTKRQFVSSMIPQNLHKAIYRALEGVNTFEGVRSVFKAANPQRDEKALKASEEQIKEKFNEHLTVVQLNLFDWFNEQEKLHGDLNLLEITINDYNIPQTAIQEELAPVLKDVYEVGWDYASDTTMFLFPEQAETIEVIFPADKAAVLSDNSAASMVTRIDETTKKELRKEITKAVKEQKTWQELKTKIQNNYGFSEKRAEVIARTETGRLYNEGACWHWKESGLVKYVEVIDGDGCDICSEINGQIWTIEQALNNPIEHPNCVREFYPVITPA
jgi:SPP1 gp7 family putative phage head morphogenesis protein